MNPESRRTFEAYAASYAGRLALLKREREGEDSPLGYGVEHDGQDEEDELIPYWVETDDEVESDASRDEDSEHEDAREHHSNEASSRRYSSNELEEGQSGNTSGSLRQKMKEESGGFASSDQNLRDEELNQTPKVNLLRRASTCVVQKKRRQITRGRSSRKADRAKEKENEEGGASDLLSALVHFQTTFRKYEAAKKSNKRNMAAIEIQKIARGRFVRAKLASRCKEQKTLRVQRTWSLLRGFAISGTDVRYRVEAYEGLLRVLARDISMQDVLGEVLSTDQLAEMQQDMFSQVKSLRVYATRFFCEFAHMHLGNQRMLCRLNGLTVNGVRLIAVTSKLKSTYQNWCRAHNATATYEDTVQFIHGVVATAHHFYKSIETLDKPSALRSSTFTYPKVYSLTDLDPANHVVGITLQVSPRPQLASFERNRLGELRDVFSEAAALHDATHKLFDDLVPSVPFYSLLAVLRRRLDAGTLSRTLSGFLEARNQIARFPNWGRDLDERDRSPLDRSDDDNANVSLDNLLTEDYLRNAAEGGSTVMWWPVATAYTSHAVEARIIALGGGKAISLIRETMRTLSSHRGMNARPANSGSTRGPSFVRRIDLCQALSGDAQVPALPALRWAVLGSLGQEDYGTAQALSGFTEAPRPGFQVRSLVMCSESVPGARAVVASRLGQGECNHDWISWGEILAHCRQILFPDPVEEREEDKREEEDGAVDEAQTGGAATIMPMARIKVGRLRPHAPAHPTQIGSTARRVHVLQKMMRPAAADKANGAEEETIRKLISSPCMEQELLILSKALGTALPILTPANIGPAPEVPQRVCKRDAAEVQARSRERKAAAYKARVAAIRPESASSPSTSPRRGQHQSPRQRVAKLRQREALVARQADAQERETLRVKMQLEWAKEAAAREKIAAKRARDLSEMRHSSFLELEDRIESAQRQAMRERRRGKMSMEAASVSPEQYRERMNEYDNYVQVRNQLVISQGRSSHRPKPAHLPSSISATAREVAPIWALSTLRQPRQRKQIYRVEEMRLAQAIQGKVDSIPHNRTELRVGGYFLKRKDIRTITEKEFSLEEIRYFCSRFGNSALTDRRIGFLVAAHFYTKEVVEASMGIDMKTLEADMYEILADLQRDEVPKAVEIQQQQLSKLSNDAEDEFDLHGRARTHSSSTNMLRPSSAARSRKPKTAKQKR